MFNNDKDFLEHVCATNTENIIGMIEHLNAEPLGRL